MSIAVEVRGLRRHYEMADSVLEVLKGVDFAIESGEVVCVMGPSGSGKSTLLNLIGGLDRPSDGAVLIGGEDLAAMDEEGLARHRRHHVGFVFQSFNLIPTLTASENVALPLVFAGVAPAERKSRSLAALEAVGLAHRVGHRPTELSGGEQQRVAIARASVTNPSIMLADEPTGNLDSKTGAEILETLRLMNDAGRTFLITTHDNSVAEYVAHRIITIIDGEIVRIERGGRA